MLENHFSTGLPDLDAMIGQLGPKRLAVFSGISQSGMTTMLLSLTRAAMRQNVPTLLVDLENGREALSMRILAGLAGVDYLRIMRAQLDDDSRAWVHAAAAEFDAAPLHVSGYDARTLERIRRAALSLSPRPRLILVDGARYIVRNDLETYEPMEDLTVGLKHLAGMFNACVVVTHPIRHTEDSERDPVPADLAEAAPLFHHADQVVLIHRPEMYADPSSVGEVELRVVKNRQGPAGVVHAMAQLRLSRIVPLERPDEAAA